MSLRARIALAAAAAVAAVTVLLGAIGYFPTRAQLIDQLRQQLQQKADGLLSSDQQDGHGPGPQDHSQSNGCSGEFDGFANSALGAASGYVQFICPGGLSHAADGGTPQLPVTSAVRALARAGNGKFFYSAYVSRTHVEVLAVADPVDNRAIEVALPLTQVDRALSSLVATFLILIGVGVALAAAIGALVSRAAVAPLNRFSSRTETVTSALDRPERLEEVGPHELRRLAVSFNRTLDALERSAHAQRHLIADASHELRTPMAALRSNIQIFLDSDRLPLDERHGLRDAIMAELDDLTQLVSDVLELARGARADDHPDPVELDEVVWEAVARAQRRAPGIRFVVDAQPTVIVATVDRVNRAVTNVIDNARKWSPPDGVVEVSLREGTMTVRDHGPGFAEHDLPHVFDRFYRSQDARRMPGSGLGLSIVKQAAEARGGGVSASNAPDGGAVVTITFEPSPGRATVHPTRLPSARE